MEGGARFGEYELLARLGAGGMAETFVALRQNPHGIAQRVCLKRILPAFSTDPEFRRLFLQEACVSARLRHSGVAQVVDFGKSGEAYYLALELIDGTDLRKLERALRTEGEHLPPHLVTYLAVELAKTLDFAHCNDTDDRPRGVVHRDISPANILLSLEGEVKLTDFGVAKAMSHATLSRTRSVKGKLPYMAPEYAKEGRYDARSDLFSLGVTLYEALTGFRPFDGATELATLKRLETGEHVPLLERVPDAPPALASAVERLILPDPAARFASGAALVDALAPSSPSPLAALELGALVRRHARHLTPASPSASKESVAGPSVATLVLTEVEGETAAPESPRAGPKDPTRTRHTGREDGVVLPPVTEVSSPAPRARFQPLRIATLAFAVCGLLSVGALYGAWLAGR